MPQVKNSNFFKKFDQIEARFQELEQLLLDPKVISEGVLFQRYAKERSAISDIVEKYRRHKAFCSEKEKLEAILANKAEDKDLQQLAAEELAQISTESAQLQQRLEDYIVGDDAQADKSVIVEIRAGTGGEEAALFVGDLFKMYMKFCANIGLPLEVLNTSGAEMGGFKEIIFSVNGKGAYALFKYESGVHRVQRVPQTEASGRIHTSAVSVAVLPEAEEIDIQINPQELKIDVYRSSGAGGQSVNTTDSAVRITHLPTGVVVTCQDERSQLKNKSKALKILRSRLLDRYQREQQSKIENQRRSQIGSGDRSEKIRTYNFPERRVTDHRINLTLYRLEDIMAGDLKEIIDALAGAERKLKLNAEKDED